MLLDFTIAAILRSAIHLTEGEILHFKGVPSFSPEILREVNNLDPMKTKQLDKGVRQMTDEGVAQLFMQQPGNRKIIGTVGELAVRSDKIQA